MRNIVLLTFDSLRADHCSFMGYDRETTPTLDTMAEDGVVFENAIAPASRTNPSMAGALTGEPLVVRDQVANPEHSRRHLARHGTIADQLSEKGYTTGAFCPNAYASRYYGFDKGFDHFEDFLFTSSLYQRLFDKHMAGSNLLAMVRNLRNFVRRQEAFKTWDTYIDEIEDWVDRQDEPFFLWIFSLDTHFPYLTPRAYRQWSSLFDQYYYNWRCNQLINDFEPNLSEGEINKIIDIYDDSIRFGDILLSELQERLSEFDPVYVIHGDHGEAFGEHGLYGHFYPSLYEENIDVPLVISGIDRSAKIEKPTPLLDMTDILKQIANHTFSYTGRDIAFATDYDGRFERRMCAQRTLKCKAVITEDSTGIEFELSTDDEKPTDTSLETVAKNEERPSDVTEHPLVQLGQQRLTHEKEILAVREAVAENESY